MMQNKKKKSFLQNRTIVVEVRKKARESERGKDWIVRGESKESRCSID